MIEQSIAQGLISGSTSSIIVLLTFKYLMPRIDKISSQNDIILTTVSECPKRRR